VNKRQTCVRERERATCQQQSLWIFCNLQRRENCGKTPHKNWNLWHQWIIHPLFFSDTFCPFTFQLLSPLSFLLLVSSMSVPSSRFRLVHVVVGSRNKTCRLRLSKRCHGAKVWWRRWRNWVLWSRQGWVWGTWWSLVPTPPQRVCSSLLSSFTKSFPLGLHGESSSFTISLMACLRQFLFWRFYLLPPFSWIR